MDRVFSVDDISDQFWSPPIHLSSQSNNNNTNNNGEEQEAEKDSSSSSKMMMMNRSSSEWAFQRFLQEASASEPSPHPPPPPPSNDVVVEIKDHDHPQAAAAAATGGGPPNVPIDSEEYQAFLKSRLNLACAAVALTRASSVKPPDTATLPDTGSQASNALQLGSQVLPKGSSGFDPSKGQSDKEGSAPVGIPSLPAVQKKSPVQVKSTTSGSSRDQSDDDELDLDTETTQNMDPVDVKRVRRMLSNRESARRSRRRKQAHLTELETQVSQLRVENSTLLKRLTDVTQKYSEAAVDNRVLKADVETLRAKVKMAEETVKRVTGLNPLFQAMSDVSTVGMPAFDCSPSDMSTDAAVPVQDDPKHHFYQQQPTASSNNHIANNHDPRIQNGMVDMPAVDNAPGPAEVGGNNKMGRTASMQRVASLEHLQKRIRGGIGSCGTQGTGDQQQQQQ